jgi:hypothetical protein
MQEQFYQDLEKPSENKEKCLVRFYSSGLKAETESLITAAKDQAFNMCYH